MKLVPMKRTAAEKKAQKERYSKPIGPGGDDYSYGLCISLDKEALAKLGLKPGSFDIGDAVSFQGKGTIKALRESRGGYDDSANVEIQITNLGIEGGSATDAVDRALDDLDGDDE